MFPLSVASLVMIVFGACCPVKPHQLPHRLAEGDAAAFASLGTTEARARQSQGDWVIVDVRDPNSFNGWALDGEKTGGRIAGAANVALPWVEKDLRGVKELLAAKGITGGTKPVLLYGKDAAQASRVAHLLATKHGVERARLHVYKDGFAAWGAAGLPTDRLAHYEQLVPPAWLARERKARPELRIFAVEWGKGEAYERAHIPGAFHLNTDLFETPPIWDLVPPEQITNALLSLGVTSTTPVVVYAPNPLGSFFAAAVMRQAGVKDVRVLNGGLPAWAAAGLPTEKGRNVPTPARDFGPATRTDIFVGIAAARKLLAGPRSLLVDVRSWKEYIGETPGYDDITARGRIPGAVWGHGGSDSSNMEDFRNPDGTMRDHHDIARAWREAGITPDKAVAFYCGTGWRASEAYLAARLMGWENVVIYDGGWYEWSADANNPIVIGDPNAAAPADAARRRWWAAAYWLAPLLAVAMAVFVWRRRGRPRRVY